MDFTLTARRQMLSWSRCSHHPAMCISVRSLPAPQVLQLPTAEETSGGPRYAPSDREAARLLSADASSNCSSADAPEPAQRALTGSCLGSSSIAVPAEPLRPLAAAGDLCVTCSQSVSLSLVLRTGTHIQGGPGVRDRAQIHLHQARVGRGREGSFQEDFGACCSCFQTSFLSV